MLLKEQRAEFTTPEVQRELVEVDPNSGGLLRARNLGPGLAIDAALHSGPGKDPPEGVEIPNLGPGFDLGVGEYRDWSITWSTPPPACDVWLTLSYMDRDRRWIWFQAFVLRLSPRGVGLSAGWNGQLDARRLKRLARSALPRKRRFGFRRKYRRAGLHELLVAADVRDAASKKIGEELQDALKWEGDYRETFGRF
jgi:hypothetical protein